MIPATHVYDRRYGVTTSIKELMVFGGRWCEYHYSECYQCHRPTTHFAVTAHGMDAECAEHGLLGCGADNDYVWATIDADGFHVDDGVRVTDGEPHIVDYPDINISNIMYAKCHYCAKLTLVENCKLDRNGMRICKPCIKKLKKYEKKSGTPYNPIRRCKSCGVMFTKAIPRNYKNEKNGSICDACISKILWRGNTVPCKDTDHIIHSSGCHNITPNNLPYYLYALARDNDIEPKQREILDKASEICRSIKAMKPGWGPQYGYYCGLCGKLFKLRDDAKEHVSGASCGVASQKIGVTSQ